jgi:hypothetical protein
VSTAQRLLARIDAWQAQYSGSIHVPDEDRHRITKPPMSGSPEKLPDLLAAIRSYLEGQTS